MSEEDIEIELPDEETHIELEDDLNLDPHIEDDINHDLDEESKEPIKQETVLQKNKDSKHEDDSEDYGKKVNKRINKLVAERNIERDENIRLRERLDNLEVKQRESENARESNDITSKISDVKSRKLQFMEDGEFEKAESLNDELLDLKIKQNNSQKEPEEKPVDSRPQQNQQDNLEGNKWLNSNKWYLADSKAPKAQYAYALYSELVAEGYDITDSELYSELDKRLGNETSNDDNSDNEKPPAQSAPNRGEGRGVSKKNAVKFTQNDVKTMREFGLDPNDSEQRKEWIKNKRR